MKKKVHENLTWFAFGSIFKDFTTKGPWRLLVVWREVRLPIMGSLVRFYVAYHRVMSR